MPIRTRICAEPTCRAEFSYPIGKGNDRIFCTKTCVEKNRRRLRDQRNTQRPPCSVEGCHRRATRVGAGICETCYCTRRRRERGTPPRKEPTYRYSSGHGYVVLLRGEHPLADRMGRVYEHRAVLYDAIGPDPHACHWCGRRLEWPHTRADHLNEDKADNRPENLVPACNDCNRARGAMIPFLERLTESGFASFIETLHRYHADAQ